MEQDFGERLKKYRREKNLTQQDLADRLQVSNKTISRWESGGGYPDVPLLVPLAKALGVSVDDLLDGEKPVRTLTRADGQSWLSFAFAIGGGALFYVADLFMPTVVCYLAYLGCLAYGVYLQRYYCYQSRWFRVGCAVMNLCVNTSVLIAVAAIPMALGWMNQWMMAGPNFGVLAVGLAALFLVAVLLTGVTMALVERYGFGDTSTGGIRLKRPALKAPGVRGLIPPVCILLIPAFFSLFQNEEVVARTLGRQGLWYTVLVVAAIALCALLSLKEGHRSGFAAVGVLALAAVVLPGLGEQWAWLPTTQRMAPVTATLSDIYERFYRPGQTMVAAALILAFLALLPSIWQAKPKAEPKETEN